MKKCSHCGGNHLREIPPVHFTVSGDASLDIRVVVGHKSLYNHLEAFICMDCAHIDWFSEKIVVALKERDSRFSQLNIELETLQKRLLDSKANLSTIEVKIAETEEKANSLDITIREQQILLGTLESLKTEHSNIQYEIRTIEQSICDLKIKLSLFK